MATDDERGIAERRRLFERRVEEQDAQEPGYAEAWAEFRASVLCHGGTDVVPPLFPDSLLRPLIDHGSALPESVTSVLRLGQQSQCHTNAVALWRSGEAVAIGTGYALSDDQLWREHSWAWSPTGELIETTAARVRYFGLRFEGERARWFADWVSPIA